MIGEGAAKASASLKSAGPPSQIFLPEHHFVVFECPMSGEVVDAEYQVNEADEDVLLGWERAGVCVMAFLPCASKPAS